MKNIFTSYSDTFGGEDTSPGATKYKVSRASHVQIKSPLPSIYISSQDHPHHRYYIKREKWAGDKVSLHSGMDGSFRGSVRK